MKSKQLNNKFLEFVYEFYKGMKSHEVTLAYEGEINHQIIKLFSSMTEEDLSGKDEPETVQKRVYHVMIECLQNITKHSADTDGKDQPSRRGILIVSRNEDDYQVTTGNIIENKQINEVKEHIEFINSLDKARLNEMYKKQMKEGRISQKGGAGLGFIDIKRKTGKNLDYCFVPLTENSSFFLFSSTIPRTRKSN
jgi:hypothetical protein